MKRQPIEYDLVGFGCGSDGVIKRIRYRETAKSVYVHPDDAATTDHRMMFRKSETFNDPFSWIHGTPREAMEAYRSQMIRNLDRARGHVALFEAKVTMATRRLKFIEQSREIRLSGANVSDDTLNVINNVWAS